MLDICVTNEVKNYYDKTVIYNKELPCFQIPNDNFSLDSYFDLIEIIYYSYYSYYTFIYFILYFMLILSKIILSLRYFLHIF